MDTVVLVDAFVFVFFWLVSTLSVNFVFKTIDIELLPAMAIGFLSVGTLNLNNMRDESPICRKNTLVVQIEVKAKLYHYF
jgi:1,4-dihydroxy-2-naphthoate octaprenyltransferase